MRILTCSNSCPRWDDGVLNPRSPGGLVPMLINLLNEHGGHWIFTSPPGTPEGLGTVPLEGGISLHPMDLEEEQRRQHYDTISIRLLLGLLHYMHDTSEQPVFDRAALDAWAGYEAVNRSYAKRLGELADDTAEELILINDPHLMLVPEFFTAQGRGRSRLTYFLGTPWCEPDYFAVLPDQIRTRILGSLLACDVVGFHAGRWVDAFLACCARFLPDVRIEGRTVVRGDHTTELVSIPFPLDVDVLDQMVDEPATARWAERLAALSRGRRMMVRADRLDLWKNIPRGFMAYEAMLERSPALAQECWFAAVVTTPSRAAGRHLAYQEATEAVVRRINERFGAPDREAASLVYPGAREDSRNCVVAALRMSTVGMINSTYDGLNLFAKEAAYLLPDGAPLLVSANAGVIEQLAPFATALHPFDITQTSEAMEAALDGRPGQGSSAAERRKLLRSESNEQWLKAVFLL